MSLVLQLSDTHFGTEQPQVCEALIALARHHGPELVVLSGDITQRARAAQFRAARRFTDRLNSPVLAIPGNHDIALLDWWARLRHPYARFSAVFGPELEPVYRSPDLLVIGLNTTRALRHKNGEVSPEQIEQAARVLAQASPAQLRIVVVHHPVAVTHASDIANLLRGHAAALDRWAMAGADLVMGGHIHLPYVMPLMHRARPLWAVQAGTAVSSRVRDGAPHSVNLLRWDSHCAPGHCEIEQWDFMARQGAFVRSRVTRIQPARP